MKLKTFSIIAMLFMAVSASAQVEILYHSCNGDYSHFSAMDRKKKLYWMDDDDNTCFLIKNYKKSGNTETFLLDPKEKNSGEQQTQVTTTVDANGHTTSIQYKNKAFFGGMKYDVKTTDPSDIANHNRLIRYFNGLAGNPAEEGVETNVTSIHSSGDGSGGSNSKNPISKVKGVAKNAAGKVKGIFKKK